MSESGWIWATASPRERAMIVRQHTGGTKPLSEDHLCDLFGLTPIGLRAILRGDEWRPQYERPAINYVEPTPND